MPGGGEGGPSTHRAGACGVTEWMYKKSGGKVELMSDPWDSVVHLHGEPGSIQYGHMNELVSVVARAYEERSQNPDPDQPPPTKDQIYVEMCPKKYGKMKGLGQVEKTTHLTSGVGGTSYGTSVGAYSQIEYERVLQADANMRKMHQDMEARDREYEAQQRAIEERERKIEEREKARDAAYKKMEQAYQQMQQRTSHQYWQSHMPCMMHRQGLSSMTSASTSSTHGLSGTFQPHPNGTFPSFPQTYGGPTSNDIFSMLTYPNQLHPMSLSTWLAIPMIFLSMTMSLAPPNALLVVVVTIHVVVLNHHRHLDCAF